MHNSLFNSKNSLLLNNSSVFTYQNPKITYTCQLELATHQYSEHMGKYYFNSSFFSACHICFRNALLHQICLILSGKVRGQPRPFQWGDRNKRTVPLTSSFHSHHIFFCIFKVIFFQIDDLSGIVHADNQTAAVDRDILFRDCKNRAFTPRMSRISTFFYNL